ncbi:MAG TPA: hypothetical protein DCE30_08175, partial [Pantoea sp.]|nr:hypothetical protein [Pantoea sp.]
IAAPMPFEAPVTSAIFPSSAFILSLHLSIASAKYALSGRLGGSAILQVSCTILQIWRQGGCLRRGFR